MKSGVCESYCFIVVKFSSQRITQQLGVQQNFQVKEKKREKTQLIFWEQNNAL